MISKIINYLGWRRVSVTSKPPSTPNLLGDRDIEWSWIVSQMPSGPGLALDFGNGGSNLGLVAAQSGFEVTAVDLLDIDWPYLHGKLHFMRGSILELPLRKNSFDFIINCSTVEHVGLAGRYGVNESRLDGDLDAMTRLRDLMKPQGLMLLTIPIGKDVVIAPLHRIYGSTRLPRLLEGYNIEKEIFWAKDNENRWVMVDKKTACNFEATSGSHDSANNIYALGCFALRRP